MRAVIALAAALAVAGCGADEAPLAAAPGTLRVELERAAGPVYIEGSIWFAEVHLGDDLVRDHRTSSDAPLVARLAPGRYRLESYQRPCDGNCANLDPETDRCEASVVVDSSAVARAVVRLTPGEGCTIAVGPS